jgi:hypothetical protein
VYAELDSIIAEETEVEIGRLIGKGASSEVFFGNFRFCPCAVKLVKLPIMNIKQIVSSKLLVLSVLFLFRSTL